MADPVIFQIEDGVVAFSVVDKAELGYTEAWQAPGGATALTATVADYDTAAGGWSCQTTSGALTASANTNDTEVPATFCAPAKTIPQPGETSYTLDLSFLQDPNVTTGLSRYLFEHDTEEVYFLLGGAGDDPPRAIGRCRALAGAFLGEARATLTADVSLPVSRKPDIAFGDATTSVIVGGDGTVTPPVAMAAAGATKSTTSTSSS